MSTTVLGRDPFRASPPEQSGSPAEEASGSEPARRAKKTAADAQGDRPGTPKRGQAPRSASSSQKKAAARSASKEARRRRAARLASVSRAAMQGVVREAQGAKKARARRSQAGAAAKIADGLHATPPTPSNGDGELDLFGRDPHFSTFASTSRTSKLSRTLAAPSSSPTTPARCLSMG